MACRVDRGVLAALDATNTWVKTEFGFLSLSPSRSSAVWPIPAEKSVPASRARAARKAERGLILVDPSRCDDRRSPLLGQHVDDVLGSWLGMDAKELAALRQDGIV
jgi:hypothetical protein